MSHITQEQLFKLVKEQATQVVDCDLLGSPITEADVMLMGAYGPLVHRLCDAAIQWHIDSAALAQPAEVTQLEILMDVIIEDEAAKLLRDYLTSDDDEPSPVRLLLGDGHSGHGLYVAAAEHPEEGAVFLLEVAKRGAV